MTVKAKSLVLMGLAGFCASGLSGCFGYRDVVDCYYPKRYSVQARNSVRNSLAPQVNNGAILDQTVWNYHFMPETADLHPMGVEHLKRLARTRPTPATVLYLQTAQLDLVEGDASLKDLAHRRKNLDKQRSEKVIAFMNTYLEGREHEPFQVVIHDPAEVYGSGTIAEQVINSRANSYRGGLSGSNPTGTSAGGAAGSSGSGSGSGSTSGSGY